MVQLQNVRPVTIFKILSKAPQITVFKCVLFGADNIHNNNLKKVSS